MDEAGLKKSVRGGNLRTGYLRLGDVVRFLLAWGWKVEDEDEACRRFKRDGLVSVACLVYI